MKIFFNPKTKTIIAKESKTFYYLPNLKIAEKPQEIFPCIEFLRESKESKWFSIPNNESEFYEFLNNYTKDKAIKPTTLQIHKLHLKVEYTNNEKPLFKLSGNLPNYVLNGIGNLLIKLFNEKYNYEA